LFALSTHRAVILTCPFTGLFALVRFQLLTLLHPTLTSTQIISLILRNSTITVSHKGQETRDLLFARLFGLFSVIQSNLLFRSPSPPPTDPSSSSSAGAGGLADFKTVVRELVEVGSKKAWLRESAWWGVGQALAGLKAAEGVAWEKEAVEWVAKVVLRGDLSGEPEEEQAGEGEDGSVSALAAKEWTVEKVAVALRLMVDYPTHPSPLPSPPFKMPSSLLHSTNLPLLAKILKDSSVSADDDSNETGAGGGTGTWKPQPHFVWDMILDAYFPLEGKQGGKPKEMAPFSDFYRVVVDGESSPPSPPLCPCLFLSPGCHIFLARAYPDLSPCLPLPLPPLPESLFDAKASSERKFWGFQIFSKALPRLPSSEIPLVFTPNFMGVWMNHLGSDERYLHKAALQIVRPFLLPPACSNRALLLTSTFSSSTSHLSYTPQAKLVQTVTASNPAVGFTLVSQLLGKNGNRNFDKVTKTKTVSSILGSLTVDGVKAYVSYLKSLVYENASGGQEQHDLKRVEARRIWAFDQMVALVKNGSIPKDDVWVSTIVEFFVVHGLFAIKSASKKSAFSAVCFLLLPAHPLFTVFTASSARFADYRLMIMPHSCMLSPLLPCPTCSTRMLELDSPLSLAS
jgi:DNA polymerase phi